MWIGGITTPRINVWALSTGARWRLKAITQRCPTDSTATSAMRQGACGVYKLKLLGKQKRPHAVRDWIIPAQSGEGSIINIVSEVIQTVSTSLVFYNSSLFYQFHLKTEHIEYI